MVKRNFGAKGTAIGAIESRLPAGLGGFAPCNPPAPKFELRKTIDQETGIVTSYVAVKLSKDMMSKYGEGKWNLLLPYCYDKGELNGLHMQFGKYTTFDGAQTIEYIITDDDIANGYVEIGNSMIFFAASLQFIPDGNNQLYNYSQMETVGWYPLRSVWSLNPYGMMDQSGIIYAGRPLVTYDGTGYFAKVVAPVGTVVVDGEDSHKSEVWLPADGKRHEVRTTAGFWGRNIYLTKDNIIRCDRETFVSDSDSAVVDFTSFFGDKGIAVYAAKQAEAQMQQLIADAVAAGKAVIDVNPASTIENLDRYEDVTFIDPGGLSNQNDGLMYDSNINGGCYRIRVIGKAQEDGYSTYNIVGMTVGDVSGNFYAYSATVHSMTVGDCGNFNADNATVETMTVGDCGNFYADSATVETMTVGDVSGNFNAASATVHSMTVGDCGNFYADSATVENMTVGDVSGNFNANNDTVETMTVGDCGNFYADSATVDTMTVGDCGDFYADNATVETMTVGDCGNFYAYNATVENMTVGDCGDFNANNDTVETMTVGDCGNFYADNSTVQNMTVGDVSGEFNANNDTVNNMIVGSVGVGGPFSANSSTVHSMTLNVTQNIDSGDVTDAQFGAIYVPASLVNDFKTTSIFASDYADIIYPISA